MQTLSGTCNAKKKTKMLQNLKFHSFVGLFKCHHGGERVNSILSQANGDYHLDSVCLFFGIGLISSHHYVPVATDELLR